MDLTPLLSLRDRVPDGTLLDALELAQLLPERPCRVRRADLEVALAADSAGAASTPAPAAARRSARLRDRARDDLDQHGRANVKTCDTTLPGAHPRRYLECRAEMPTTPHLDR